MSTGRLGSGGTGIKRSAIGLVSAEVEVARTSYRERGDAFERGEDVLAEEGVGPTEVGPAEFRRVVGIEGFVQQVVARIRGEQLAEHVLAFRVGRRGEAFH